MIFLIINLISNQSIIIDVLEVNSRNSKMYDSELKIYPHYTDIELVDNIYQLEDFTLSEIDLVLLDDIINNDTDLIYNYKPIYEILVSPPPVPFFFDDNQVVYDGNEIDYETEYNEIDGNIDELDFNNL